MRIEEITKGNVVELTDDALGRLRHRAVQMYERTELGRASVRKRSIGVTQPVERDEFMRAYSALTNEMGRRAILWRKTDLDAKLLKRIVRGVDVAELPPIVLREAAVCLTGEFVDDPRHTERVSVWLDSDEFPGELQKRLAEAVLDQTGKDVAVVDGLEAPVIACYDLVLMPRPETEDMGDADSIEGLNIRKGTRTDISKPFANEHAARQEAPGRFREFRRQNNKFGTGVHAIWGILPNGKTKLQSIRFSAAKFTPAQAKAWLKERDYKTSLEAAVKKSGLFIKSNEERIVGGIVYAPDEVDGQGDYTDAMEIWKALKTHMIQHRGKICIMHDDVSRNVPIVECFQADEDTAKGGETIPAGAWYLAVHVPDNMEPLWKAIKAGEITGFSMAGSADVEDDE